MQLDYESYKGLEDQMKEFLETTHKSTDGFYHRAIRLYITPGLTLEFHGPLVKAAEKEEIGRLT